MSRGRRVAMRIGELAQRAAVTPDTIRYYERVGLLGRAPRAPNRYRDYAAATLDDLRFIHKAQALGLKLHDIQEVMEVAAGGAAPCGPLRAQPPPRARGGGVDAVFKQVRGVVRVVSGSSGGSAATAHYNLVSTDTTGHAESVEVTYAPAQLSYGELLRVFFTVAHNPTELDRQGPDEGTQYRSVVFYSTDAHRRAPPPPKYHPRRHHLLTPPTPT